MQFLQSKRDDADPIIPLLIQDHSLIDVPSSKSPNPFMTPSFNDWTSTNHQKLG